MDNNIYAKFTTVRDKYPKDEELIGQFLLIVFKNGDAFPTDKLEIEGFHSKGDIQKILTEFGYFNIKIIPQNNSRNPTTLVIF